MKGAGRIALFLIFFSLWAIFLLVGQILDGRYKFLGLEGAVITARAILSAEGTRMSLVNLPMTHPPLPYLISVPFAEIGLPNPSIWVSSFFGGVLGAWFLYHFRGMIAQEPMLGLGVLMVPLQPGLLHSSVTGSSTISSQAPLAISTYLVARFILEQQELVRRRSMGKVTAWLNEEVFKAERMRFLWSSALLLALSSLGRFDLIFAFPIYLIATPWLLPKGERRDIPRVLTVALVYLFPLVAVQVMWSYLCWVFTGDAFYGLKNPSSYFQQVGHDFLVGALWGEGSSKTAWEVLEGVGEGIFFGGPVLLYLLIRIGNIGVWVVCLAPYFIFGLAEVIWGAPAAREVYSLAYLQAVVLVFVGEWLGILHRKEEFFLPLLLVIGSFVSWYWFVNSPVEEEQVWKKIVSGRSAEVVTFSDERRITKYLVEREMGRDEIMLDEVSGFAFVTLLGSSRMFVMPHEKEFKFYVKNPHLDIKGMLMRNPERGRTIGLDKVGQEWRWMNFEQRELFRPTFVTESWVLYERRLLWKGLR